MHLYGKKHLKILFSKTEDALWLNLCIYYWEHLHACTGYVTQVSEPWPVGLLFISFSPWSFLFFFFTLSSLSLPLILFISFSLCSLYLFFPSSLISFFSSSSISFTVFVHPLLSLFILVLFISSTSFSVPFLPFLWDAPLHKSFHYHPFYHLDMT